MEKRKAAFHNLGCKVNAYETEAMQQLLEKAGYEIVPFAPWADVYVINTCTVTNMADRILKVYCIYLHKFTMFSGKG